MRTQCHSKLLEFDGHCSRGRRLVAKKLVDIFLSFVPLGGLRVDPVRNAGQACRLGDRVSPSGVFAFLKIASTIGQVGEQRRECWAWSGKG